MAPKTLSTDILILGSGGAGLFAALHAHKANPSLSITVAVKGLLGKCGCTRMVQGGYNVALAKEDSIERHFMDTIRSEERRVGKGCRARGQVREEDEIISRTED